MKLFDVILAWCGLVRLSNYETLARNYEDAILATFVISDSELNADKEV